MKPFRAGDLAGWIRTGEPGDPQRRVLLLHGGPGLDGGYLMPLLDHLPGWTCAGFQQRGLAPSTTEGPFDIPTAVADVATVLDALAERGWDRPLLAGHSYGGHLALHAAASLGGRLGGVLLIETMGAVGDMGVPELGAELLRRLDDETRARVVELDRKDETVGVTVEEHIEHFRLVWPGYFADPAAAPPFPDVRINHEANGDLFASAGKCQDGLVAALRTITVPLGALAGDRSPMPATSASGITDRVPGAWLEVVEGAGHFPWHESPGAVAAALERLLRDVGPLPAE